VAREDQALQAPDETAHDFTRFPRKTLRAGTHWYRQHQDRRTSPDRGIWYFASHPDGVESDGRFDLAAPNGTCYLATSEVGAVNELIGPDHTERGWVDADLLDGRALSKVALPADVKAADTTAERASAFRLTNELPATERYDITQAWAQVLHDAGFAGVYAVLRFTPGTTRGLALFGDAGPPTPVPPGDPSPTSVREVVERLGIDVVDRPAFTAVSIVHP